MILIISYYTMITPILVLFYFNKEVCLIIIKIISHYFHPLKQHLKLSKIPDQNLIFDLFDLISSRTNDNFIKEAILVRLTLSLRVPTIVCIYAMTCVYGCQLQSTCMRLLAMLHFTHDLRATNDRLHKTRNVIDMLRKTFSQSFQPYQRSCIKESLFSYKGRLSSLQRSDRRNESIIRFPDKKLANETTSRYRNILILILTFQNFIMIYRSSSRKIKIYIKKLLSFCWINFI